MKGRAGLLCFAVSRMCFWEAGRALRGVHGQERGQEQWQRGCALLGSLRPAGLSAAAA